MKEIKISFHSGVSEGTKKEIVEKLCTRFEVVESENYDYYFAMETIYKDKNSMRELFSSNMSAIRIMICGEAIYPDMNIFDYAIWFCDDEYQDRDRIVRVPLLNNQIGELFNSIDDLDNSKRNIDPEEILRQKKKFCNFIYSNPNANEMRDIIFHELSKYKKVDSLGSHLKNVEIKDTRYDKNWRALSVELKRPYKFSIAAENGSMYGYTTEKMMSSMLANTIPIYWGNRDVGKEYNVESFINASSFDNVKDLVERVIEVDQNDTLYCDMMSKPWRTQKQITECNRSILLYDEKFFSLFMNDKEKMKRRPNGTWAEKLYPQFLCDDRKQGLFNKVLKKIKK